MNLDGIFFHMNMVVDLVVNRIVNISKQSVEFLLLHTNLSELVEN